MKTLTKIWNLKSEDCVTIIYICVKSLKEIKELIGMTLITKDRQINTKRKINQRIKQ